MRFPAVAAHTARLVAARSDRLDGGNGHPVGVARRRARHTMRQTLLGALACLCAAGCLPKERLNDACRFTDDVAVLPPPGDPARRAHLIEDVRVAQWLGIRHGDVVAGRVFSEAHRRARAQCTDASFGAVMRHHGVARAELAAVTGAREPWVDLLVVFLPVTAIFLALGHSAVRRVVAGYDPEDHWVATGVLAVLTPLAAGFGLGMTQMWAWLVEMIRVRDEHISYRAGYLPSSRHGWLIWGVAMGLFAAVAAAVVLRRGEVAPTRRGAPLTRRTERRVRSSGL